MQETDMLTSLANLGLSNSTHKVYQTVINHIKRCEQEKNISLSLPFNTKKTFSFISYLLFERKVSSKTCDKYLSGVRMYHLTNGHDVPILRPAIVSLILKGKENWEDIQNKMTQKPQRIPVTVKVMKLLKRRLRKIDWTENKKTLVWAVSCICWNGSFCAFLVLVSIFVFRENDLEDKKEHHYIL